MRVAIVRDEIERKMVDAYLERENRIVFVWATMGLIVASSLAGLAVYLKF
jgi:hypothetical protein